MKQEYSDILTAITDLIRDSHNTHIGEFSAPFEGCTGERARPGSCRCVAEPKWWDQNGVPRFATHGPELCPSFYADEVALLVVACQQCAREFKVQLAWDMKRRAQAEASRACVVGPGRERMARSLAEGITLGTIHYGDPPHHADCGGVHMNVWDLRVLEFWSRRQKPGWHRVPELEITLPDTGDPER